MRQRIGLVTLVVRDYDEALAFYVDRLGFLKVEDSPLPGGRRWVTVIPPGAHATRVLLAQADGPDQLACVGRQTGGRVAFILYTDDFARDHAAFVSRGVRFEETPRHEAYGTVAVFQDLYGNRFDLIERRPGP